MKLGLLLSTILLSTTAGAQTLTWKTYSDPQGAYTVNYPEGWETMTQGKALVIRSVDAAERGIFGITLRTEGTSKEAAVERQFADPEHAQDLQKAPARIADQPAIKVWGSKKGDPHIRSVEYYIEKDGQQYYILFQAPHTAMARYSPVFNAMISSLKFTR